MTILRALRKRAWIVILLFLLHASQDAFGNRVSKTVSNTSGTTTTQYLVDDLNPTGYSQVLDELTGAIGSAAVTRTYTYDLQRISQVQIAGSVLSFYEYDGGGSVRQLTNFGQQVTDTYEYDAFGNQLARTGSTPNNYLYRGEQWDPDLSLYYLRARYYNPVTGRFLSRDPKAGDIAFPHTLHRYLYASADPVDRIDPSGRADAVEVAIQDVKNEGETAGGDALARQVSCILGAAGAGLNALGAIIGGDVIGSGLSALNVVEAWETCSATATGEVSTSCGLCFAAGTPIHTPRGDVPIENIHEGDEVVSRNSETGKLEHRRVTALTPPHKDSLLEIRIEGERTPLHPTWSHPFWVKRGDATDGSWIEAGNMLVGDLVQTMQGSWRRVVSITPLPGQETVYNFTVEEDHDYFVGEQGLLVHNAGGPFSIWDWSGYPEGVPQPSGPFNLLDGPDYQAARQAANNANQALHEAAPELQGFEIHEIQPVKFGGSPTDLANKMVLEPGQHHEVTNWWRKIQACGK
jgi:RHS repeat-associated protein